MRSSIPTFLWTLSAAFGATVAETSLPIVDLGYELQQASAFNATGNYYNFSNIRFAAPPLGNLRWAAPQPPAVNRSHVQTGTQGRICPQAEGDWTVIAEQFIPLYLSGQTVFNSSSFNTSVASSPGDPRQTEDCLFLDVIVPKKIFENSTGNAAPVLVWFFGGGNAYGSKDYWGNPAGLLARSEQDNDDGVVYVAFNYRLGALGFLAGSEIEANGTANGGLYDQRFALEWIQKNIHLFGGDASRVTVFGESAGGSGIMHQITAYGGMNGSVPFAQALSQSPAFLPTASDSQKETLFTNFLSYCNVSTLAEARELSTAALQSANARAIAASPYGGFTYGPVTDGKFVPDLPGKLLAHGQFDKSLKIMTSHVGDEGLLFTSPYIQNTSDFAAFIELQFPILAGLPQRLNYITDVLYPEVFNGTYPYTNQIGRAVLFMSEALIGCNAYYINTAFQNQTHSYLYDVSPSLHAEDVPYYFYNGVVATDPTVGVIYPEVALELQSYITNFAKTGDPNGAGLPYFPQYQNNATLWRFNGSAPTVMQDPLANARCDWWQQALYY